MQSMMRTGPSLGSQRLCGNRLTYSVVAAPSPAATATRQVTTMAKKKGVRIIVTMECTEARGEGNTPSRYTTQKVRAVAVAVFRAPPLPAVLCAASMPRDALVPPFAAKQCTLAVARRLGRDLVNGGGRTAPLGRCSTQRVCISSSTRRVRQQCFVVRAPRRSCRRHC